MLSAVIVAADDDVRVIPSAEAIVRTLSGLVPGVVEGVIRDVVLVAPEAGSDLRRIAEAAGCEVAEGVTAQNFLGSALTLARSDRLLVMRAGWVPEAGFFEEIFDRAPGLGSGAILVRATPATLPERILLRLSPAVGLIATRSALARDERGLKSLIAALRPRSELRTRLRPV